MPAPAPNPAQQRIVLVALIVGMTLYIVATAIVLQTNAGAGLAAEPVPALGTAAIAIGATTALGALLSRTVLRARAAGLEPAARQRAHFTANLVAIALLEGGSLFGTTTWLLNGTAVPGLAVALVLLSVAIALLPGRDDA